MAHFAQLDDNGMVIAVYPVSNDALDPMDEENSGIEFLTTWSHGHNNWKQCSYNGNFRKRYPAVGDHYDCNLDAFIIPQPFPSWTLNDKGDWEPPIPKPEGSNWIWNESEQTWLDSNDDSLA